MPVDLLLCEGEANSPDVRILTKLLVGACGEVRPSGSKYGMGHKILARREVIKGSKIAGLLDGDFQQTWPLPGPFPLTWSDGNVTFGWRWGRKEIENYVIDPTVVSESLGSSFVQAYRQVLEQAADVIPVYEAARTALATSRKRLRVLPSSWGRKPGSDHHPFPDDVSEKACRNEIRSAITTHGEAHAMSIEEVLSQFDRLLPEFRPGGSRRRAYLDTYAGKDLLWAMDDHLGPLGFANSGAFREKVLLGIEKSPSDIATWVPEWRALRRAVDLF